MDELEEINMMKLLGVRLGLRMAKIERILKEYSHSVEEQKVTIITTWLRRNDRVRDFQSHRPTWNQLAKAVEKENVVVAESIRSRHVKRSS